MDQEEKRRFVERAQRALRKHKGLEEIKRQKLESQRRKASARKPKKRRWTAQSDEEAFDPIERIRAPEPLAPRAPVEREAEPSASDPRLEEGLVVGASTSRARLALRDEVVTAALAPSSAADDALAVGDRVLFERRAGGLVLVRTRLPRTSWLARPDPADSSRRLVLAANVDTIVAVVAARQPTWKPGFVDRVLLAAEEGRAAALVVVNKLDLVDAGARAELERALESHRAIGVAVHLVSCARAEGLVALVSALAGRTCVLVGPSGVGKSSLVNALDPPLALRTGTVRSSDGKGRHTTTAAELVELANGTRLIDTPGVRQLGLAGLDRRALASYFPELAGPAKRCRFRDCSHLVEPDCAVRAAVEAGAIPARRFEVYRRIHGTLE